MTGKNPLAQKTTTAIGNSQAYNSKVGHYTGVDGRVYRTEPQPIDPTKLDLKTARVRQGLGFPSMIEIYRCERFLSTGFRCRVSGISPAEKERIIKEYSLSFDNKKQRYTNSSTILWQLFLEKFGEQIRKNRIETYEELVYRSKNR